MAHGVEDSALPLAAVSAKAARQPGARLLLADTGHAELPRSTWSVLLDGLDLIAPAS